MPVLHAEGADDRHRRLSVLRPRPRSPRDASSPASTSLPGQPQEVHHVILFRVPPGAGRGGPRPTTPSPAAGLDLLRRHRARVARREPRRRPVGRGLGTGRQRDVLRAGVGIPLRRGSPARPAGALQPARHGVTPDRTPCGCVSRPSSKLKPLETMLCPRPSSCLAAAGRRGPLCDRDAAVADVDGTLRRQASASVNGLLLLCSGTLPPPAPPSPARAASRRPGDDPRRGRPHAPARLVDPHRPQPRHRPREDAARHPGLGLRQPGLGPDPGAGAPGPATRCGSPAPTTRPARQAARPAGLPARYVVWGEGTTDEMCLGLLSVTRP